MGMPADYVDVAERIREFRAKYPDGSLQRVDWGVHEIGEKAFVYYTAAAYRSANDERPGIGTAWEPFPGPTAFTKDSELMNAETSAWGRAIIAAGAADAKRVASANEVANRAATERSKKPSDTAQSVAQAVSEAFPDATIRAANNEFIFGFGKHRGKALSEVPSSYLQWLIKQPATPGYEEKHAGDVQMYRAELDRRSDN